MNAILDIPNLTSLIVDIIGVVVIVISVLYLAKQTKQANIIAQGDSEREMFDSFNELLYQYADFESIDVIQRALADFNNLSNKEKAKFCISYMIPHLNIQDQFLGLYERGLITKKRLDAANSIVLAQLKTRGGRQLWEELQYAFRPDFVDYITAELEKAQDLPPITDILTWLQPDEQ